MKWCCLNVHERLILAACWIYTTAMLLQRRVGKCGVGVLPGKVSLVKCQVRVFVFVCIRNKLLIILSVVNLCIHYDFAKLIPIFYLLSNLLMHFICLLLIYYRKTVFWKKKSCKDLMTMLASVLVHALKIYNITCWDGASKHWDHNPKKWWRC